MPRGPPRSAAPRGHPSDAERRDEIEERRARALEEPLDFRRLPGSFVRLEVRNPIHGTHYRVLLPTYPSPDAAMCTCTDFARSGLGTCKHIEAAFRWMTLHPAEIADPEPGLAGPPPSWKEIDRQLGARPRGLSPARRMSWAGEILLLMGPVEREPKEGVGHRPRRGPRA